MIPNAQKIDGFKHYAQESALQLAPGYADVTSDGARLLSARPPIRRVR